ncbi:MAG: translation initiation factor IF-2 subunit beta [Nanoarchaeota archaeon]|nr:translation initiation factor IF-2 subunit beta [Nanoarchaeota archaeon]
MDYEKLLDKAVEELPESTQKSERFEIPKVRGHLQGNKTVVSNFAQIAQALHREPAHILKYILKELAAPGDLDAGRASIGRKLSASAINQKILLYARTFVMCGECRRPDTTIEKKGNITFMKCSACGASKPIHAKI